MRLQAFGQTAGALCAHDGPGLAAPPHIAPREPGPVHVANGNPALFAHTQVWNTSRVQDAPPAARENHGRVAVQVETARGAASLHPGYAYKLGRLGQSQPDPQTVWMEPGVTVLTCQNIGDSDTAVSVIVTATLGITYAVVSLYASLTARPTNKVE